VEDFDRSLQRKWWRPTSLFERIGKEGREPSENRSFLKGYQVVENEGAVGNSTKIAM